MSGDRLTPALPPLVGGILIGGGSRRMGRPKALLEWDGATFVERIAAELQAVVPEIVLLGATRELPAAVAHLPVVADRPGPRVTVGSQGPQGPLLGLLAAFDFRPGAAWLILTCDQPLLTAATLEWLIAERRPGRIAVLPRRTARSASNRSPASTSPGAGPQLAALAAPERRGSLQPLAALAGVHVVPVPGRLAGELDGVNTAGELAELRRRSGSCRVGDERSPTNAGRRRSLPVQSRHREVADVNMGGPAQAPIFSPGEIVSGRYRISTYLGQGAAGEVYGAEDLHLRSRVALKVLRPGASRDPQSIERFKREILLARRVSHPNVCRIFDLGIHEVSGGGEGSWQSLLFLTMEWLEGETLSRRIQEAGGFDEGPAVAIVRQLTRGLAAAHDAGIVHRDLKSSNILLVPGADGERAVITDFGLARSSHQSAEGLTLTEAGGLLGTPAYMAPEQVAGLPATAASDIYALGVVLYEMLTASLPFHGDSPLEVAVKRLREPPTPIETYRAGISARFRETIERCMAQEPERRFADAGEVIRFLDPPTALLGAERLRRRRPARSMVAGLALLAALGIAGALWKLLPARNALAPGGARAGGGGRAPRWLADRERALAERLGAAGHRGARLRECDGASGGAVALLGALGDAHLGARGERRRARGARRSGGPGSPGPRALPFERPRRRNAAAPAPHSRRGSGSARELHRPGRRGSAAACRSAPPGDRRELHQAVLDRRQRGDDLRSGARGRREPAPRARDPEARASAAPVLEVAHPASPEAVRLYAGGLEALRSFEPGRARDLLERSIVTDPEFPLARAALAAAWFDLGYDEEALAAAGEARKRSSKLSRSEELMIEGLERRLSRDWPRAIEVARTLWRFYPDDLEQGLRLAQVELEAGESKAALATVAELRRLPSPSGEDPRIDLVEARSRRRCPISTASSWWPSGPRRVPSRPARARSWRGPVSSRVPRSASWATPPSRRSCSRARTGSPASSAIEPSARSWRSRWRISSSRAVISRAPSGSSRSRAPPSRRSATGGARRAWRSLSGSWPRSAASWNGHGSSTRAPKPRSRSSAIGAVRRRPRRILARCSTCNGISRAPERRHQAALATFRQLEDRSRELVALANLGQIRRELGDFAGSDRLWQQALDLARTTGDQAGEGDALLGLGENRALQGDVGAAGRDLAAALALFEAGGEKPKAATVRAGAGADRARRRAAGARLRRAARPVAGVRRAAARWTSRSRPTSKPRAACWRNRARRRPQVSWLLKPSASPSATRPPGCAISGGWSRRRSTSPSGAWPGRADAGRGSRRRGAGRPPSRHPRGAARRAGGRPRRGRRDRPGSAGAFAVEARAAGCGALGSARRTARGGAAPDAAAAASVR